MSIKVLDPKTIARIAAGEVVERPASIVKELVENSLDAGARQITVETCGGGISFIRTTDNGSGIASADVEMAFQRHATSKLNCIEDLESITTLGFRGEALPSIAAVADMELVTAVDGVQAGDFLTLKNGEITTHTSQARPPGTTITINDLFRSVPARLKFLKSLATENSHIAGVITQYALAYPEVKFTLIADGKTTLQTTGTGNLSDVIIAVYGIETAQNMTVINRGESVWQDSIVTDIRITGMVSSPVISRSGRDYLSFFVNRRAINSRILTFAAEEAYSGLLMQGRHPIAVINIALPPSQVDVNMHPTKSEVKFQDERTVFNAVQRAVRGTLVSLVSVPKIEEVGKTYQGLKQNISQPLWQSPQGETTGVEKIPSQPGMKPSLPLLRVLGQVAGNYIVAEGPDGVYIIDQHAAHERVMYEKIKAQWANRKIEVQGLLEPAVLEITPQQDAMLKSEYHELSKFGFTIEPFGERTYLVRAVPAVLSGGEWLIAIREILDEPATGVARTEAIMKSLACHSVVRAGQSLIEDEMKSLIRLMEAADQPYTCPHGRPTLIHLTIKQLAKEFGRT